MTDRRGYFSILVFNIVLPFACAFLLGFLFSSSGLTGGDIAGTTTTTVSLAETISNLETLFRWITFGGIGIGVIVLVIGIITAINASINCNFRREYDAKNAIIHSVAGIFMLAAMYFITSHLLVDLVAIAS